MTGYFQRPHSNIGDVLETFNGGYSKYNGLQARFQEQGFHGLWLLDAFTWSRDFGNVSDPLSATHGFSGSPQDNYNLQGDYGPLQYDTPDRECDGGDLDASRGPRQAAAAQCQPQAERDRRRLAVDGLQSVPTPGRR